MIGRQDGLASTRDAYGTSLFFLDKLGFRKSNVHGDSSDPQYPPPEMGIVKVITQDY